MLDKYLLPVAVFLMLCGFFCLVYCILLKLMAPKKREPYLVIIPLRENDNCAALLGYAFEKRNVCGETRYCEILAVDLGLDGDTRAFLERMYGRNNAFRICRPPDAGEEILRFFELGLDFEAVSF